MATVVTIDSVTTDDAAPTAAPHRISNKSGRNTVTVKFSPVPASGQVRYWSVRLGGISRKTGTLLRSLGGVCGISVCGPDTRALLLPFGAQVTVAEAYAQLPSSADGDYAVNIYAMNATSGWNA